VILGVASSELRAIQFQVFAMVSVGSADSTPSVSIYTESVAHLTPAAKSAQSARKFCPYVPLRQVFEGINAPGISLTEINTTDIWAQAKRIVATTTAAAFRRVRTQEQGQDQTCTADDSGEHEKASPTPSTCSSTCFSFDMVIDREETVRLLQVGMPSCREHRNACPTRPTARH
jgi:hypothetical protein